MQRKKFISIVAGIILSFLLVTQTIAASPSAEDEDQNDKVAPEVEDIPEEQQDNRYEDLEKNEKEIIYDEARSEFASASHEIKHGKLLLTAINSQGKKIAMAKKDVAVSGFAQGSAIAPGMEDGGVL